MSDSLWPHALQHARPPCPLPEFTQTHVHWVGDAIQPSHPLLSPSPSTFNLSQHQGLFKWVSSSHQVAKLLEFQLQHLSLSRFDQMCHLGPIVKVKSLSRVQLLATLWTAAHQAPPSMGFSRQEYWSRLRLSSLSQSWSCHKCWARENLMTHLGVH